MRLIIALIAYFWPFLIAEWTGAQLSKFFLFTLDPLKIKESMIYEHLSGFLENILIIKWIGELPSESCMFRFAPLLMNDSIIVTFSRTIAKWRGEPNIPPPLLISAPPSIKS